MIMKDPFGFNLDLNNFCFLCGDELFESNKSKEHIFPKWMLKEFELQGKKLILQNETTIPYQKLTIPCCKKCNNESLSSMEETIRKGVIGGYDEFIKISDELVISWVTKLYMGVLIKESKLIFDRSNQKNGYIVDQEILDKKNINFLILRSIYHKTQTSDNLVSLFKYNVSKQDDFILDFDYKSPQYMYYANPSYNTVFLKMNDIGLILFLQDAGLMKDIYFDFKANKKTSERSISYFEFIETFVRLYYKYTLTDYNPKYITVGSKVNFGADEIHIVNHFKNGFPAIFSEWDSKEFYACLLFFCKKLGFEGFSPSNPNNFTFIKELSK